MELEDNKISAEGYHKLEIYQLSQTLALQVHQLTLTLPQLEMHEEGSQIRRSSKSISNNIVEGYALRKHKNEFLQYLNRAYGSCEETIQHLDFLFNIKSLKDETLFKELHFKYNRLSKMLFRFIQSVNDQHEKPYYIREDTANYSADSNPQSTISNHLQDRIVLITRSADKSSELRSLLESHGASVICFPTIEIAEPDSWEKCDATIWKLAEYDSVCFTSKNAVDKFVQRIRLIRPQALNTLATRNLYAVGEKTKSILESNGFSVQPIPMKHTAENLAHSFYGQNISGKHFLFPKSNIASGILPKELRSLGALVDEIATYKTVIPETENLEHIRNLITDGKIDIITFFSPSSVRNFIEMIGVETLQHILIAVIGPTTAEAAKEVGVEVNIIAEQQTAESLAQGIVDFFKKI